MENQVKQVEFTKLRHAYLTIKKFLEHESRVSVKSLRTTVAEDLGLFGNDNVELLEKFIEKFELSHRGFHHDKHFYSERELSDPGVAFLNLLTLSVWLPLKSIELLTFNKVKLKKPGYYKHEREVTDLTFRDLLTWYIEGRYSEDRPIKYEIKTSHNS